MKLEVDSVEFVFFFETRCVHNISSYEPDILQSKMSTELMKSFEFSIVAICPIYEKSPLYENPKKMNRFVLTDIEPLY